MRCTRQLDAEWARPVEPKPARGTLGPCDVLELRPALGAVEVLASRPRIGVDQCDGPVLPLDQLR
jgi:hypothetical protein